jgi:hypothetical protein
MTPPGLVWGNYLMIKSNRTESLHGEVRLLYIYSVEYDRIFKMKTPLWRTSLFVVLLSPQDLVFRFLSQSMALDPIPPIRPDLVAMHLVVRIDPSSGLSEKKACLVSISETVIDHR